VQLFGFAKYFAKYFFKEEMWGSLKPRGIAVQFTVEQWVDVFTRKEYIDILIESLCFCQRERPAGICMGHHEQSFTSHYRLFGAKLSDIMRDFKKFTSGKIIKTIESSLTESRKIWLLSL
jgi:REP-associated tyrosine transposase